MKHLIIAFLLACFGLTAAAADTPAPPSLRFFYPGDRPDSPMPMNIYNRVDAYFENGAQVVSCRARITQNNQVIGYLTFAGSTVPSSRATMTPGTPENAANNDVALGIYTLDMTQIKYIVDGTEYEYADEDNPLGSVSYTRVATNGTIVSESGIEDHVFKSYYELDDPDGVKTYTFSKPVLPDPIYVFLEYGEAEQYFVHKIEHVLSDDGLTLTIDFRGVHRTINDYLAPGHTFIDEKGDPLPPPTSISLNVEGLTCSDGSYIETEAYALTGEYITNLVGRLYVAYDYVDQSFPTPVITSVEFYDKNDPSRHYKAINDITDMMDVTLLSSQYIESADMVLTAGDVTARIPDADIVKGADLYTVAIPDAIRTAASDEVIVSFDNVVYTMDDGLEHTIKPFNTSQSIREVLSIAALKALDANQKVSINVPAGVRVTLANQQGYTFVEDDNDGIMILTPDYSQVLRQGTLLKGRIVGTYLGYGSFMIDKDASAYTESVVDVSLGAIIEDADDLESGKYDSRLVTIKNNSDTPITVSDSGLMVCGKYPVVTDFIPEFETPEQIHNITGIFFKDSSIGVSCVLLRNMADINHNFFVYAEDIATLKTVDVDSDVMVSLYGAKITYSNEDMGIAIVEDETGAMMVYMDDDSLFGEKGTLVTGEIPGYYMGSSVFVAFSADYESHQVDVTNGALMSIAEAAAPENIYRLVTFNDSAETPIVSSPSGVSILDCVFGVDYFGDLWDFDFPKQVKSFTGIIVPGMQGVMNLADEGQPTVLVALRSASDVVELLTGLSLAVSSDDNASSEVYNLQGVKVRDSGDPLSGLHGIYLTKDGKIFIK